MPLYQTVSSTLTAQSSRVSSAQSDRNSLLRPEDAFYHSPPRKRGSSSIGTVTATSFSHASSLRNNRDKRRGRSSSRQRKARAKASGSFNTVPKATNGQWKKLLWVKQSYPDNYTDEETFLDHLQRNPRIRPYQFWALVADSTIIVQHVCSVMIFICCFSAIFQERVGPQTVVGWASLCTIAGWVFRDYWQTRERESGGNAEENGMANATAAGDEDNTSSGANSAEAETDFALPLRESQLATPSGTWTASRNHSRNPSLASIGLSGASSSIVSNGEAITSTTSSTAFIPPYSGPPSSLSPRMQERLGTAKSAILIYCSLLGLSPILKSLTQSTSSDSIWALSSWLLGLNIFTFDYGAGPEVKFPASLSTNAALMASTVLASRLPSTTHVFSLTLFSIEVFGLFPVFRRHLRHHSWTGHLWLTAVLVVFASGGLSVTISGRGWTMGIAGVVLGSIICCLSMGMTSWWLIGLQRYKNEIHGPWDPARPVIRRHWD